MLTVCRGWGSDINEKMAKYPATNAAGNWTTRKRRNTLGHKYCKNLFPIIARRIYITIIKYSFNMPEEKRVGKRV